MEFNEKLFQALKNDDLQEFRNCMELNPCGSLRLGRFPVLSVMYLYNSRRILHAYEKGFLRYNSWQDIGEPMELSAKFRAIAGKCLRIYLNETVSPVEMLLLLNRDFKLKKIFPETHMAAPAKQRLAEIYYVKWGLHADIKGDTIALERRPLTHREKMRWLMIITCAVLCVAIIVSTPFVVNVFAPFIKDGGMLTLSKWEQMKFDSDKTYALKKDITVPADFFQEEMTCNIVGNGHTVTILGDILFNNLNGEISDVTFHTNGTPLAKNINGKLSRVTFQTEGAPIAKNINGTLSDIVFKTNGEPIAENINGKVENVTVNVVANLEIDKNFGFVATNNYGLISDVEVNISGSLSAVMEDNSDEVASYMCGGVVAKNGTLVQGNTIYYGRLENCAVHYDSFSLVGQLSADASFGGLVGQNDGYIINCQTSGEISADTFDVAGICSENNYGIIESVNNANINQHSDVTGWNPLAAGIVLNNHYAVDGCINNGNISCTSTAAAMTEEGASPTAYATGIAYQNITGSVTSYLQNCTNNGNITSSASNINASAAGVCNFTNGATRTCINNGNISASGATLVEAAGIVNFAYGYVYRSANTGAIFAESDNEAHVGGIVATSYVQTSECFSKGKIDVSAKLSYVGGILGFSAGLTSGTSVYFGTAEKCVSACEITVTPKQANSGTAVGGIVGFMEEMEVTTLTNGREVQYIGGEVFSCYFTGTIQTGTQVYTGGIVGVVGANIYVEPADGAEGYFHDNVYSADCGAHRACGATLVGGSYNSATSNVGTTVSTLEEIREDKTYLAILKIFGM